MIFNELTYAVLLIASLLFFYTVPRRFKSHVLALTGLVFYALYASSFLLLLLVEIIVVYAVVRSKRQVLTPLPLILPLSLLAYYKYKSDSFFYLVSISYWIEEGNSIISALITFLHPLPGTSLLIPLGISFFTFELIHYTVEFRRNKLPPHGFMEFLAFIMFFPTRIAGPIKRFPEFNGQVYGTSFHFYNLYEGGSRILIGLFKKLVLADTLAIWADNLGDVNWLTGASSYEVWLTVFAFSWMIYFDFSGYADIAIGSARMFDIRIPENFNRPYFQKTISLFWKSWHITLCRWLIDYVYIPLGGSRVGIARVLFNILITWFLSGLWHGAGGHFLLWGVYHGMLLSLYRIYLITLKSRFENHGAYNSRVLGCLSIIITFVLVSIGWVFFASNLSTASMALGKMFLLR